MREKLSHNGNHNAMVVVVVWWCRHSRTITILHDLLRGNFTMSDLILLFFIYRQIFKQKLSSFTRFYQYFYRFFFSSVISLFSIISHLSCVTQKEKLNNEKMGNKLQSKYRASKHRIPYTEYHTQQLVNSQK